VASNFIYILLTYVVSAIPLNIAVKLLEGKSSWFKAILANVIVAVLSYVISAKIGNYSGIITFIALLFIYKIMFHIGWFRAFIAWALQGIIIAIFWALMYWLLGVVLF